MEEYKLALTCFKNEDYVQGQALLKISAEEKHYSYAYYLWSCMYLDGGFGVPKNFLHGMLFIKARILNNPRTLTDSYSNNLNEDDVSKINDNYAIGYFYLTSDTSKAIKYLLKSAIDDNDFFGQYALFLLPELVEYSDRVKWLKLSAKNGYWKAQYDLFEHTNRKSMYWLTKAANQKYQPACIKLAHEIFNGKKGGEDWKIAAKCLMDGKCDYEMTNRIYAKFPYDTNRLRELYQYKDRTDVYKKTNTKVKNAIFTWILIAKKYLRLPRDIYNLIARTYLFGSRENPIEWDIY